MTEFLNNEFITNFPDEKEQVRDEVPETKTKEEISYFAENKSIYDPEDQLPFETGNFLQENAFDTPTIPDRVANLMADIETNGIGRGRLDSGSVGSGSGITKSISTESVDGFVLVVSPTQLVKKSSPIASSPLSQTLSESATGSLLNGSHESLLDDQIEAAIMHTFRRARALAKCSSAVGLLADSFATGSRSSCPNNRDCAIVLYIKTLSLFEHVIRYVSYPFFFFFHFILYRKVMFIEIKPLEYFFFFLNKICVIFLYLISLLWDYLQINF